jgi:hypothetical protein
MGFAWVHSKFSFNNWSQSIWPLPGSFIVGESFASGLMHTRDLRKFGIHPFCFAFISAFLYFVTHKLKKGLTFL